jgi:hypothetical protein
MHVLATATALALLGAASSAQAATRSFTVNDHADAALANPSGKACVSKASGKCTLRAAVQAADNLTGTVVVKLGRGTYNLTIPSTGAADPSTGDLDLASGVSLTVDGKGAGSTTIDVKDGDRAFTVGAGASLTVSSLTITGGDANVLPTSSNFKSTGSDDGGAIYSEGSLLVSHAALTSDQALDYGGAIYVGSGATSTRIVNSTISRDLAAYDRGGGIDVDFGSVSITKSTLDYDSAGDDAGGAVMLSTSGSVTISHTVIDHDFSGDGGALADSAHGPVTISGSDLSDDSANYYAGGLVYYGAAASPLTVTSTRFDGDSGEHGGAYLDGAGTVKLAQDSFVGDASSAGAFGGGIFDENNAAVTVSASSFIDNSAVSGGAYYFDGFGAKLIDDTLDSNSAYYGAGIYFDLGDKVRLINDTIAHNAARYGGGIDAPGNAESIVNTIVADNLGGDCDGTAGAADLGHNLDSDGSCFSIGVPLKPEQTGDLIERNPLLGLPGKNGGPTETDALHAGSPAIGHGLASQCPKDDQRGVPFAGACDIGAVQFRATPKELSVAVAFHGHTVHVSGKLQLPRGVAASAAHGGSVAIIVRRGSKTIAKLMVRLSSRGTYAATKRLHAGGSISVTAEFLGNAKLNPVNSQRLSFTLA